MPIKPAGSKVTPEAERALAMQGIPSSPQDDTVSAADDFVPYIGQTDTVSDGTNPELALSFDDSTFASPKFLAPEIEPETGEADPGDIIDSQVRIETESDPDAAIAKRPKNPDDEPVTKGFGRRRRKNPEEPKGTAPNADEWLDFFSRIVIRFITEWYADFAFRGIDEDIVSDRDAERLLLTEEERDVIARPFAEYANKNPFMKKHGREIVAFADSFESIVILGRWFSRVNRIAAKYRPRKSKPPTVRGKAEYNGHSGQSAASANGTQASNGSGFVVYNPGGS
jgi:hypothetical protein